MGLPALLVFLGVGMVLGDSILGITFTDTRLAADLGFAALVVILAEGGLTTKWDEIRPAVGMSMLLATISVGVTVGLVALFASRVFGLSRRSPSCWGGSWRPPMPRPSSRCCAVWPFRAGCAPRWRPIGPERCPHGADRHRRHRRRSGPRVRGPGCSSRSCWCSPSCWQANSWGWWSDSSPPGRCVGCSFPRPVCMRSPPWRGAFGVYELAEVVHVSGFAAAYVASVVLGNSRLPHRQSVRAFAEGLGWIAQIGLFVMLGLLASPHRITLSVIGGALVLGLFLTLVARPISVALVAVWFRVPWREQVFMSWAGLRGAVPIILCTIPLAAQVPGAEVLFDTVLVLVIAFTFVQGPTLPWVAHKLGLLDPHGPTDVDIEAAPLDRLRADLLQVRVPVGSKLAGVSVQELRLPKNSVVSLVIRDDTPFAPAGRDRLQVGDELMIITPTHHRRVVEDRLTEIGRGGRLARWYGVRAD